VHALVWASYTSRSRPLADTVTRDAEARARARRPSVPVTSDLPLCGPVQALLAEGEDAALLVLGSRALGRFTGAVLGSVSLPVVAGLRCPAVVVREPPAPPEPGGPVVLGVGVHGDPAPVVAFALAAAAARGCPLRAVQAWRVPRVAAATAHTGHLDEARSARHEQARRRLDDVLAGVPADTEVHRTPGQGRPAEVLLAASEGASLLVVGAHRRQLRTDYRLGPVGHAVLHHAPCPVAVVPHT
jgi:nucleotide-binding universal stress UspA family protein